MGGHVTNFWTVAIPTLVPKWKQTITILLINYLTSTSACRIFKMVLLSERYSKIIAFFIAATVMISGAK